MITTEDQLLRLLITCGFEFTSSVRDIAQRFPKELDWGVPGFEVVPFRLRHSLAELGEIWKIPVNRDVEFDLPPVLYKCEFHPTDDARKNHDQALAQLVREFGPGEAGPATNVYERHWRIGFFTLRVTTWPRELNRRGHNSFQGKNPYLWISANVTIEPEFPFVYPTDDARVPLQTVLKPSPDFTLVCDSVVYTRRNQAPATSAAGLTPRAFQIRTHDRTVAVPFEDIQGIRHTRVTPGRYSGSSSIALETLFFNRHCVRVTVANGSATASLDQAARQLALVLQKPLTVEEYSDDG